MNKITFPLKIRMQGAAVTDLQTGLQVCLDRGALLASDPATRRELATALAAELDSKTYGDATAKLVSIFQRERQLLGANGAPSGEVDERTAAALNALLDGMGLIGQSATSYVVSGQVRRESGLPFNGVRVRAVDEAATASTRSNPLRLGEDTTDVEGRYTIRYVPIRADGVNLRVTAFDGRGQVLRASDVIRQASALQMVDVIVPDSDIKPYKVEGIVGSRVSPAVSGLQVILVDKGVGGDQKLAEAATDERGAYQASFSDDGLRQRGKARPDLQARVFANDTFLGASEVRYNAEEHENLNVVLDDDKAASALQSEHALLTGALQMHFQGQLGDLKENSDQQDITYLANKTGWDARAVALAALADQFSARTVTAAAGSGIPQQFFYALFRAGLPANEEALYQTDAATLEKAWKAAADQNVIPKASADQIPGVIKNFQAVAAQKLLTAPALVGTSSIKELLTVSRLTDAQQATFAQLYATHRTDMAGLWTAVGAALGQEAADRLQVNGKLAFLTVNNATLMDKVHATAGANGLTDPLQLAQSGYHHAKAWDQLLTADVPVPKEIPGDTPTSQRANYAGYLAAQVRLSYPTAALARMVKTGEVPLKAAAVGASDQVHAFLTANQGKFEIGVQPVQQYILRNNLQIADEVVAHVKQLQRVYQITPSDEALTGLMKRGIDAAYHVTRYDKETFVQSFAADLGGADQAMLTYDKSVQVHNAVLNIAVAYLNARTAPAVGTHSPPVVLDPAPANASDVIAYATLESVFGSMDFCSCDHCQSILSPAAYLVDLLLFLQSDPAVWIGFAANWKTNHGNAPYPFADQAAFLSFQTDWNAQHPGNPLPNTEISPLEVLVSRRPDLQHLPLTCENTNTALPYIDVVNETLEYFVANSVEKLSLQGYEGHDTSDAASEDLLASPQFVMNSAYTTLRGQYFPTALPFHQPLESLRRYFTAFEVPLAETMEGLRKNDDLERGANPYGWRDILMEALGLSRDEYAIFTDNAAVPLSALYGFPAGTADAEVIAALSNVKRFSQRTGVSYEDLIAVLRTRFINPNGDLIPKLQRLGVSFATLQALKEGTMTDAAFDALLPTDLNAPDPAQYGGDIKQWVKDPANFARITGLITLAVPAGKWKASTAFAVGDFVRPAAASPESTLYFQCTTAGNSGVAEPPWPGTAGKTQNDNTVVWTGHDAASCASFEDLAFRYSDPEKIAQNLTAVEFVQLVRFIRLWKKLGWPIPNVDAAVCGLFRADLGPLTSDDINTVGRLNTGFLTLLPRLGILVRAMTSLNLKVKSDLLSLVACWSDIDAHGDAALYRQMFLNPALLQQDAAFADNGYGEFLTNPAQNLIPHAEALRSAFNLTSDEYDLIAGRLGYSAGTVLNMANVSAIYRRGWLARRLKLSVRELLLLIDVTGLDPFAAPDPANPAISRLIALVHNLKDRGLKTSAALYLIWNQDLSGKSAPDATQIGTFARLLRLGFADVDTEFTVVDDPDGSIAQTRMAIVYGTEAASFFFGLLNDTLTVNVGFNDPDATLAPGAVRQAIDHAAGLTDAGVPRISYDDFRKQLFYSGVLRVPVRDAIKAAAGVGAAFFKTAIDQLYDQSQAATGPFFARYPELTAPYEAYVSDVAHSIPEKRTLLLEGILPDLVKRKKRQQALQAISAVATTDLSLSQAFLDGPAAPFPIHAAGQVDEPALNDFLAVETLGLSATFFASDTATGPLIPAPNVAPALRYAPSISGVGNPLPANPTSGAAISGIWSGYLEAPESGFFNLRIEADAGAHATLMLDGNSVNLVQNAALWVNADPIELRARTLYPIVLTLEKVRDMMSVQWEWQPKGQGRTDLPGRNLYPAATIHSFKESYIRFLKAAALDASLSLTPNEMRFFATHPAYQINGDGWLNALSVGDSLPPNVAAALLRPLEAILEFARIKSEVSPVDESLLTVLSDPVAATQNANSVLFNLTRWNQTSLTDLLDWFGANLAGLGNFELFRRVYDAFALAGTIGISVKAFIQAATNNPSSDTVRDFQAALRARYDSSSWRDVVRPINDEMRSLQRDALVAYILHQMGSQPESAHIDTPDKLFEYFLMDVQMDPCMQTSRIRHALSSVQLFVERCLMNLEPRVSSAAINAKQWEWMKRYRVWEANRKVYLFPENWLEPELRDDKSPFFKEIESELLQSDITEERAGVAVLNYLSKLEEVAKLEPCGIHYVPPDPATRTGEVNHVVARTSGALRKYFYRRFEYGYWTAWEQIKLDIEDNPILPVVWNDRLFLFWLRIVKQGADVPKKPFGKDGALTSLGTSDIKADAPTVTISAVLSWSEYYNGKWQPSRTSDVAAPLKLDETSANGFDRSKFTMAALFWTKGALRIIVSNATGFAASFFLHNASSTPELRQGKKEVHFAPKRNLNTATASLNITYTEPNASNRVLDNGITDETVQPNHPFDGNAWDAPFFYDDARHSFYVTTTEKVVWIPQWNDFGIYLTPPKSDFTIPSVVFVGPKTLPDPIGPILKQPGFGAVDPSPIERYVSEDAYIHQGLGTSGTVSYNGAEITLTGSQLKGIRTR